MTRLFISTAILSLTILTACEAEQDVAQEPIAADTAATDTTASTSETTQRKINLNTATEDELLTIPNVGDRMVGEFLEYRPYVSISQFRQEIGKYVDQEQVAAYEEYVYVPVDPNESDAATIRQLPGVDETEAAELVEGRPYASHGEFLTSLEAYVSTDELAAAELYLAQE